MTVSPAMLRVVHKANERFSIDEDVIAAGICLVSVGAATRGMNARIAFAHGVEAVDKHVVGTTNHGSCTDVSARRATMRIAHY